jgi:hypothetical protein
MYDACVTAMSRGVIFAAAALAASLISRLAAAPQAPVPQTGGVMSSEQQNLLVKKRCVTCHNDVQRKGGLSLVQFDAMKPDPSVARMMLVKVTQDGAMAAAGGPVPERETVDAFANGLSSVVGRTAQDSNGWTVDLTVDPMTPGRGHSLVTARFVREAPSPVDSRASAVYQLSLSCNGAVRRAGIQVSTYTKAGSDAPAIARPTPTATTLAWPRAADTLKVSDLFPGESVVFPIGTLSPTLRDLFSWCNAAPDAGNGAR